MERRDCGFLSLVCDDSNFCHSGFVAGEMGIFKGGGGMKPIYILLATVASLCLIVGGLLVPELARLKYCYQEPDIEATTCANWDVSWDADEDVDLLDVSTWMNVWSMELSKNDPHNENPELIPCWENGLFWIYAYPCKPDAGGVVIEEGESVKMFEKTWLLEHRLVVEGMTGPR